MAHHKSAIKRIRTNEERRIRNRANHSRMKTAIKKWRLLIAEGKLEEAEAGFSKLSSEVMKSVPRGFMHRKTASRRVSRLARELNRVSERG